MKKVTNLQWPDRLAIMNRFQPSDDVAAKVFGVAHAELVVARDLESQGTMVADPDIDVEQYASLFVADTTSSTTSIKAPSGDKSDLTGIVRTSGKGQPPLSATKRIPAPKKRGRKGTNIASAFAAIPATPTPVDDFAKQHGVSVAVLRQSKRFDTVEGAHPVRVKKDKATKTLMIWREADTTES